MQLIIPPSFQLWNGGGRKKYNLVLSFSIQTTRSATGISQNRILHLPTLKEPLLDKEHNHHSLLSLLKTWVLLQIQSQPQCTQFPWNLLFLLALGKDFTNFSILG